MISVNVIMTEPWSPEAEAWFISGIIPNDRTIQVDLVKYDNLPRCIVYLPTKLGHKNGVSMLVNISAPWFAYGYKWLNYGL